MAELLADTVKLVALVAVSIVPDTSPVNVVAVKLPVDGLYVNPESVSAP